MTTRRRLIAVLPGVALLAACGGEPDIPGVDAGWECEDRVTSAIEYPDPIPGHETPEEAAVEAFAGSQGPSAEVVARAEERPHYIAVVAGDEVVGEAHVVDGQSGWYVDEWTECDT